MRRSGVENLMFFIINGGIDNKKVLASLGLFAKAVMPQF